MPRVFVVEDDELIRETIGTLLEMEGYEVQGAANGREALDVLHSGVVPPCIILLDLMMPVMSGVEFRKQQLQDPELADVPVVVITGRGDVDDIEELRKLRIIQKPFRLDMVLATVGSICATFD